MISLLPTHLSLGLRPHGKWELVNLSTGEVSFTDSPPAGDPLHLCLTLETHPPFPNRDLAALSLLRSQRTAIIVKPKATRKSPAKKPTQETQNVKASRKRTTKNTISPSVLAAFGGGDPTDLYSLFKRK